MARLASLEKGGFYATPPRVTDIISTWAQATPGARLLDPFAGESDALCTLSAAWDCIPYAVELHAGRYGITAAKVEAMGGRALHGAMEFVQAGKASFGALYLNPPYHEKTEADYVVEALRWLAPGGLMLALIPEATAASHGFLSNLVKQVEGVVVRRFPLPEYERFKQVVVMGRKRYGEEEKLYNPVSTITERFEAGLPTMERREFCLPIPPTPAPRFRIEQPEAAVALSQAANEGLAATAAWGALTCPSPDDLAFHPLEQPKPGHAAMLIAAGVLNGTRIETPAGALLVKGLSRKYVETDTRETDAARETVESERMAVEINAFNLDTGGLETYSSREPGPYQDFLKQHADALQDELNRKHAPRFGAAMAARYTEVLEQYHAPGVLPGRTRDDLLPAQREKAAALAFALKEEKAVILVGEMGCGKTTISIAALYLRFVRAYAEGEPVKVVVMCPSHLTRKWKREAETCLREFGVAAHIVKSVSDVRAAMEEPGPSYLILSKEKAKLGSGWEPAYLKRKRRVTYTTVAWERPSYGGYAREVKRKVTELRETLCCPDCGAAQFDGDGVLLDEETWGRKPRKCRECRAPLWQLKRRPPSKRNPRGSASYPLAIFLNKHYSNRYNVILDELHQLKGATSQQGLASQHLISGAKKVIAMTGTIYGGKASSLFHLLYRLNIARFRALYMYDDVNRFIDHYGLRERVTKEKKKRRTYGRTWTYEQTGGRIREIPGASPGMVALLLPNTAFVGLADIGVALPAYREHVEVVPMDSDLKDEYDNGIMRLWRDEALQQLRDGEPGEFAAWLQGALGYPDCPEQGERGWAAALKAEDGWAKDREIVALVKEEVAVGRCCFIYCGQVKRRDPRPRLARLLAAAGIEAVSMNSSVAPEKREAWLKKAIKGGAQVVMANPANVETGLDLIDFPTLIYLGVPTYSIYTIEQSKRRSWRLGQTEDVDVYFFVYGGTVQHAAINLLSDKARAADLVHGDVSRGLAALNAPANDFLRELTQQVMRDGFEHEVAAWEPEEREEARDQSAEARSLEPNGKKPDPRLTFTQRMHKVIGALAEKHGMKLGKIGAYMKLHLGEGFDPLNVEVIGPGKVAVSHTFIQNGDVMLDPEVTFYVGFGETGWVPTSITQPQVAVQTGSDVQIMGGYKRVAGVAEGGGLVEVDFGGVAELAEFADWWAGNVEAQGWLERGEVVEVEPEEVERLPDEGLVQLGLL